MGKLFLGYIVYTLGQVISELAIQADVPGGENNLTVMLMKALSVGIALYATDHLGYGKFKKALEISGLDPDSPDFNQQLAEIKSN